MSSVIRDDSASSLITTLITEDRGVTGRRGPAVIRDDGVLIPRPPGSPCTPGFALRLLPW
jgi:hypothetical protein